MVVTGLIRNQFVVNSGTWVRIPPSPLIETLITQGFFFISIYINNLFTF